MENKPLAQALLGGNRRAFARLYRAVAECWPLSGAGQKSPGSPLSGGLSIVLALSSYKILIRIKAYKFRHKVIAASVTRTGVLQKIERYWRESRMKE